MAVCSRVGLLKVIRSEYCTLVFSGSLCWRDIVDFMSAKLRIAVVHAPYESAFLVVLSVGLGKRRPG